MSVTSRPVSVDLYLGDWETLVGVLSAGGPISRRLAKQVHAQLPGPAPTGLGAVVRARRDSDPLDSEPEVWILTGPETEETPFPWFCHRRRWWLDSWNLRVTEVLSPGVDQ